MKLYNRICMFFNRISKEISLICVKKGIIFGAVFLILGIISWILSGDISKVVFIWEAPNCAIPVYGAFVVWGISFFYIGFVFLCIFKGMNRFCRRLIYKELLLLIIMQMFTYMAYPLFFCAAAPFLAFLSMLLALSCCILVIKSLLKYFSLWSIALGLHSLWLLYSCYVAISYFIIN